MRRLGLAAIFAMLLMPASAGARGVPHGWVGMMADGPLFSGGVDYPREFQEMHASGVQTIRVAFYWDQAQPYPSFDRVPADQLGAFTSVYGVPTGFGFTDSIVAAAKAAHLRVLPVILRSPPWATRNPGVSGSPPSARGRIAFRRYVKALIFRYRLSDTIHAWQIFNEPNMRYAWNTSSPITDYVRLLKSVYPAIKRADPHARVVLAGMSAFSARALKRVYQAGGRRYFDVAAVHPFRSTVRAALGVLHSARAVMRHHGDARKELIVSEISWPSARGKMPNPNNVTTTEMGQANRLFKALRKLAAQRTRLRLYGLFWSTWMSRESDQDDAFDWAGLRRVASDGTIVDKPALLAFRSAIRRINR